MSLLPSKPHTSTPKAMDWFSWLSKTNLDPSLIYEYGLTFSHNELEEDDLAYFNHEFLQSIGINIAKHRLEILKLAKKERKRIPHRMSSKLLHVLKQTKRSLSKCIHTWCRRDNETAMVLVPAGRSSSSRWKSAMVKRNTKRGAVPNGSSRKHKINTTETLLLTNGTPLYVYGDSRINSFSSPLVHDLTKDQKDDGGNYDEYWSSGVDDFRWDSMFHNLKPT